jgi:hypothetical protein
LKIILLMVVTEQFPAVAGRTGWPLELSPPKELGPPRRARQRDRRRSRYANNWNPVPALTGRSPRYPTMACEPRSVLAATGIEPMLAVRRSCDLHREQPDIVVLKRCDPDLEPGQAPPRGIGAVLLARSCREDPPNPAVQFKISAATKIAAESRHRDISSGSGLIATQ